MNEKQTGPGLAQVSVPESAQVLNVRVVGVLVRSGRDEAGGGAPATGGDLHVPAAHVDGAPDRVAGA